MKIIFKLLIVCILVSTSISGKAQQSDTLQINRIVNDTNAHADILYGYCTMDALKNSLPFKMYWDFEYTNYPVDTKVLDSIHGDLREISIKIVFASWCDDSRQQLPRFIKVLENTDFDLSKLNIIAVDKMKKAGEIKLHEYDIVRVPTFIVYRNGVEIGRIIETPLQSIEKDLLLILSKL